VLSIYAAILASLAGYGFFVKDNFGAIVLVLDVALILFLSVGLLSSVGVFWDATFAIAVVEPIFVSGLLSFILSAILVWALYATLVLSSILVLALTDWDVEVFFGKEFAFPPVFQLRALRRR
jgi:hypothetical protein